MNATPRISINRVTASDAADLIVANLRSAAYHRPWVNPFTDQAGFDAWFARDASAQVSLVSRENLHGGIVGVVTISQIVLGNFCSAYLGFYGMAEFAAQGLMTETLIAAAHYAFHQCGLHRLEANIQPGNHKSIALVRRAGFKREGFSPKYLKIDGVWRDHERWALLRGADGQPD